MIFKSLLAVAVLATANAAKTYQKFADQRCHGFHNIPDAYYKSAAPLAGTTTPSMTVADCQAICEKNSTCVSFEMRVGIKNGYTWCSGSASCAPSNGVTLATTATDVNYKYTTYVLSNMATYKIAATTGYTLVKDAGCVGHDDGTVFTRTHTPAQCAAACSKNPTCISFEWRHTYNYCYLSSTCARANGIDYYAYTDRHLFVDATKNTYPTAVPAGYVLQADMYCSYRDDTSLTQYMDTLETCAQHCTKDSKCVSFEWTGRDRGIARCYLSDTCAPSKGVAPTARASWDLYTKVKDMVPFTAVPTGFTLQKGRHCVYRNELKEDRSRAMTVMSCAAECQAKKECASFEWTNRAGGNYCHLSRTCAPAFGVKAALSPSYYQDDLYIKSEFMVYQTTVPAGFELRKDQSCSRRDDTTEHYTETLDSCATLCNDDEKCVSFEWTGRSEGSSHCYLSHTCSPSSGVTASFYHDRDLYIKAGHTQYIDVVPTGYTLHKQTACGQRTVGQPSHYSSVDLCSARCDAHAGCVSFQWNGRAFNGGSCLISETCAKGMGVVPHESYYMYDLYVKTVHDTYPTAVPAGFTLKEGQHCHYYDDSTTIRRDTLQSCTKKCEADADCVSFEWDHRMGVGGACRLSNTCAPSKGLVSSTYAGVSLYIKNSEVAYVGAVDGFQRNENRVCHGQNDAGTYTRIESLASCAARCVEKGDGCVSFEWSGRAGTHTCYLSSTCSAKLGTTYSTYDETDLYVKDAFAGAASVTSKYYTVSTSVPTGFKLQQDKICHSRDLGLTDTNGKAIASASNGIETLAGCAQKCRDLGVDCVSFEWSGRSVSHTYCWLSKTCAPALGMLPTDSSGRDVYIKEAYNMYPTVAPAGYTIEADSTCGSYRRDLGYIHYTETIQSCAALCDAKKECVSFEWNGRRHGTTCSLSSTCAPSQGVMVNENSYGNDVYIKTSGMAYVSIVPTGFDLQKDRYCYKREEHWKDATSAERYSQSLESCAALCRANSTCVSFEWDGRRPGGGRCYMSTTCAPSHGVLATVSNMGDLYIKSTEMTYTVSTPSGYTLLADTYCSGVNTISYSYTETVATCAAKCNIDATCVSFAWSGRSAQSHATCRLTSNCAKAKSAVYTRSKRTDLFVKDMYSGTAAPSSAPTMQPTYGAKECVAVTRPLGWTVPTSCDTTKCREWDCSQWCQCFTHDDDVVYTRNGCDTDDGSPCNCATTE